MSTTPRLLSPLAVLIAAFCAATAFAQAPAQGYPNKPIRLIVPVAPGGGTDFTARLIGQKLNEAWGQLVIVDNRPGAAGNLGVELAAKALADGYTLVMPITSFPINPSLYRKLPFDTVKDFAPVTLVALAPLLLVVNPSVQAMSVKELIALAKSRPGQLNFANSGSGTTAHLAGELFKRMAGIDIVSIPYKGGGPAVIALLGGQVQIYFSTIPAALSQVKAEKLRALAVTSSQRVPELPDMPTVAEVALPGFEVVGWFGLFAPAGTPKAVIARLNGEVVKILAMADVRERFSGQGLVAGGGTPEALASFLKNEIVKWGKLIQEAGIRIE
jgi:tripartite-type tricarboxylate transporter receptor subunit TctC